MSKKRRQRYLEMKAAKAALEQSEEDLRILEGEDVPEEADELADVLDYVNKEVMEHNTSGMFVTVWLGIIELSTGKVIAANAGHDDALICHKNRETAPVKTKHNIVIGAFEEAWYTNFEFMLEKGDKMLLYTDGLTEATDAHDQLFGRERAIQALDVYKDKSPKAIIEGVKSRVDEFVGQAPQFDDLTMLCLEFRNE